MPNRLTGQKDQCEFRYIETVTSRSGNGGDQVVNGGNKKMGASIQKDDVAPCIIPTSIQTDKCQPPATGGNTAISSSLDTLTVDALPTSKRFPFRIRTT